MVAIKLYEFLKNTKLVTLMVRWRCNFDINSDLRGKKGEGGNIQALLQVLHNKKNSRERGKKEKQKFYPPSAISDPTGSMGVLCVASFGISRTRKFTREHKKNKNENFTILVLILF